MKNIEVPTWTAFKALVATKNVGNSIQMVEKTKQYEIFLVDADTSWTYWMKKTTPASEEQEEFEQGWLAKTNRALDKRDSTGKVVVNPDSTFGPLKDYSFEFTTADESPVIQGRTWASNKSMYSTWNTNSDDPSGTKINSGPYSSAIVTAVDLEPPFDLQIGGGEVYLDDESATGDWFVDIILVPAVPSNYGGNVQICYYKRIRYGQPYLIEARSMRLMRYSATHHTNVLRLIVHHPAGQSKLISARARFYQDKGLV